MTRNAENLAKAWILSLDPSILVRISKEKWFSRCFLSLKLVISRPPLVVSQNGSYSLFMFRVSCFSRSGPHIFTTASKLGMLLSPLDPEVHHCSELFSRCGESGFRCSDIELRCNEHSLP